MAALLASEAHLASSLREVRQARRADAERLFSEANLDHTNAERAVAVLSAIAGAKASTGDLTPVWTMPGNEATVGRLMSEFHRLVDQAQESVTCATYNFETSSKMWGVLQEAASRPELDVTVYVDADKGQPGRLVQHLRGASVYRSATLSDGPQVVSHAKFTVIDHKVLLLASANFSYSAENRNVEFGLLVEDAALAQSIESTMASKQGSLYERVIG